MPQPKAAPPASPIKVKSKDKEEIVDDKEVVHADEDILYHQLRARSTKALCNMLKYYPENAVFVAQQGII